MEPNFIAAVSRDGVSAILEDITHLTLGDVCRACEAHADIVMELISEGVIDFTALDQALPQQEWRFTGVHLHRAKVAIRLNRDLGVNFAGAALVLQLLDELEEAKVKLRSMST